MLRDNSKTSIHFLIESSKRADSGPPRIDGLVAELSKLPPEIVHSVLDDLPLEAILDLTQHHHHDGEVAEREAYSGLPSDEARKQASYFDHCVLTHLRLKSVFPELSELIRLSSIWSVYSTGMCIYFVHVTILWPRHKMVQPLYTLTNLRLPGMAQRNIKPYDSTPTQVWKC